MSHTLNSDTAYGRAAHDYQAGGWSPLPLPAGRKSPPPIRWTGYDAPMASGADVQTWVDDGHDGGNVGLRLPDTVIGLDVDAYDRKPGANTLHQALDVLGPLPDAPRSTSRGADVLGPGVEVIHHGHRYAVAWPSVHPNGGIYRWYDATGNPLAHPPAVGDLPELPAAWVDCLDAGAAADRAAKADTTTQEASAFLAGLPDGPPCQYVTRLIGQTAHALNPSASRHDTVRNQVLTLIRAGEQGHAGAREALATIETLWLQALARGDVRDPDPGEWKRMVTGAIDMVTNNPTSPLNKGCCGPASPDAAASGEHEAPSDEDAHRILRDRLPLIDWHELWSRDDEEEWIIEPILPARRLVALFSPPKIGKSLLMLEVAVGVARGDWTLGYKPDRPRRVLYVDFENDPVGDIRSRLKAMGHRPDDLNNLCYLSFPSIAKLDTPQGGYELLQAALMYGCEVIIIDTVSRAIAGEENSNDTWLSFYRHTGLALKQHGIACARLDHTGKDQERGMRGGSAKYGDVDAVWRLREVVADRTYQLDCTDHRMRITEKTIVIERRADPHLRHHVQAEGRAAAWSARIAEVIKALDDSAAPTDIGRDGARGILKNLGVGARNDLIGAALKRRRELAGWVDTDG